MTMKKFKELINQMKNKKFKGFTLVELLAVIVVLAIIMLIAIPAVLNTLETARKKAFMEYVDKAVGLSQQKYLEGSLLGDSGNTCYIYVIESDLGLTNTGKYKGFVLVAPTDTNDSQYWVLLYDDHYFLDAIDYKEFQNNSLSKLNTVPAKTSDLDIKYFASALQEKGINCETFNYSGGTVSPANNEDGTNEGTDCEGQKVPNTVPKNASGLYKLIAEKAYMDNVKSEHVEYCDGIKIDKPTEGFYYDYDLNRNVSINYGNGIGVYEVASTKDNKYPIYYYRGLIDDNYVMFANKCWRIVKTTSTGGIKMIYNGDSCSSTSKSIGSQRYDNGYMYITSNLYMHGETNAPDSKAITAGTEYLYGNDFTYSGGEYTLTNTVSLAYNTNMGSNLSDHHYTCLNTSGKCSTIYYIYNVYNGGLEFYKLTGGKSFETSLNEMVNGTSVSSAIKQTVDKWYEDNLMSYESFIEDTPYCETKTFKTELDVKTINISGYGKFEIKYGPDFNNGICSKANAYTVSSSIGNGALKYPIAILNSDDLYYAGEESGYSFIDSPASWVMNPKFHTLVPIDEGGRGAFLYTTGYWDGGGFEYSGGDNAGNAASVRPAISLKSDVDISGGNGTKENPYVIKSK